MRKERITDKEGKYILIIYYIGSSLIIGVGAGSKNDAWLSVILGVLMAAPMLLVYARLLSNFPEKGLFEILDIIFGKVLGKMVGLLYIWYSFHLGALVIRNFGEFINTATMPETPIIVPMLSLGILCIVAARSGIEVIGRISAYSLPLILFIILVVQLMGMSIWEFHHLKPFLADGFLPVLKGAFSAFSFPFSESVILMGAFFTLKTKNSSYKIFLQGTAIAGIIFLIITLRNILVLGEILPSLYFPSHVAVSRINIGDFLQRIEVSVAVVFIIGVFIKSSVCLLVSSIGIAKLFQLNDYRSVVIQMGLIMVYFSYILYDSIFEMRSWAFEVYSYYAFPFQVIIPLLMLLIAEIKGRINKNKANASLVKQEQ